MAVNMHLAFQTIVSDGKISVKIRGLPVTVIIDSGAKCNVIGRNVREHLKALKACRARLPRSCVHVELIRFYKLQARLLQKCLLEREC